MNENTSRRKWRFSVTQLMFLVLGFAIGFAPMQYWRMRQPPKTLSLDIYIADVPTDSLEDFGFPDSRMNQHQVFSDTAALMKTLNEFEKQDSLNYWSGNTLLTDGMSTRMELGMSQDYAAVADDGSPGIVSRYDGNKFELQYERLSGDSQLLSFDVVDGKSDYSVHVMIGEKRIPSYFERRIASQIVIPNDKHVGFAGGKYIDGDGIERELILIFAAEQVDDTPK